MLWQDPQLLWTQFGEFWGRYSKSPYNMDIGYPIEANQFGRIDYFCLIWVKRDTIWKPPPPLWLCLCVFDNFPKYLYYDRTSLKIEKARYSEGWILSPFCCFAPYPFPVNTLCECTNLYPSLTPIVSSWSIDRVKFRYICLGNKG